MKKKIFMHGSCVAGCFLLCALKAFASENGVPLFSDDFNAEGTFVEQWVSKMCSPKDGKVRLSQNGSLSMRGETPLEFIAEADVTVTPHWSNIPPTKPYHARGGFLCGGHYFAVQPCGKSFMVWKPKGQKRMDGRYVDIPGLGPGQIARLRVMRKKVGEGIVKYAFWINGIAIYDFIDAEPAKIRRKDGQESYPSISFMAYKTDVEIDNFALFGIRHDDDSPNMIFNSSFEYDEDGTPTHYGFMGGFAFGRWPWQKFRSDYLTRYKADKSEKHSGQQSLRVRVNGASSGKIQIRPWRTGTVKDAAGVFSVWMKANVDNLTVNLYIDETGRKTSGDGMRSVTVDRTWRRYEVTRKKLKGKGLYSPITITVPEAAKYDAFLWLDDLQFEVVALPEGGFDPAKSYASVYKPSEADKDRFGKKDVLPPSDTLVVKKLAPGVKPTVELDRWAHGAGRFSSFWNGREKPKRKTEAFLACDDNNFYLGVRNYAEPASHRSKPHKKHRDGNIFSSCGIEFLFRPNPEGSFFHFAMAANGDQFDHRDNDLKWNGSWTVETRENPAAGAVDYFITVPFADLAPWGMSPTWRANICRNDNAEKGNPQHIASGRSEKPEFRNQERWNPLVFPADVIARWAGGVVNKSSVAAKASVLGRLDFYMNEDFAQWRVTDEAGKVTVAKKPLTEIPMGTNEVSFAANGKTYTDTVVKLPWKKGATQVNRWTRSIVHDGRNEVFTGIGIGVAGYLGCGKGRNPFPAMFDMLKAEGFRHFLYMSCSRSNRMAESRAILEASRERGLLCAFWGDYNIWNYNDKVEYELLKPIDDVPIEKTIALTKEFDHIVTHLVIDEPELFKKSEWTRKWLEMLKPHYPYSPVQMNNTIMGIPSRHGGLKTDILMLDDYLSNNEGRTVDSVVKQVDEMIAVPGGKPCWFFLSGDIMSLHYKNLSYAEQVAQSWGCICAGCTGIAWYFDIPRTEGSYLAMVDVNREVQQLAPVILSEELCAAATADQSKSKLRHLTRTLDGAWYVLSCNIDAKSLSATFTLPVEAPQNGTVEVLFENRTIPLKDGRFSDEYAGHSRHIYKIR